MQIFAQSLIKLNKFGRSAFSLISISCTIDGTILQNDRPFIEFRKFVAGTAIRLLLIVNDNTELRRFLSVHMENIWIHGARFSNSKPLCSPINS